MASALDPTDDVVLVGHPFAPIGMGEHVRSSWRAFAAAGLRPGIRDIYGLCERNDPDIEHEFASLEVRALSEKVNIFHINGDEVAQALPHLRDPAFDRAYNIIYPAWELSRYPDVWTPYLNRFDEVWAPSEFIAQSIRSAGLKNVHHMPLAVDVKMSRFLTRREMDLPEDQFIFLFFFDFSSYMSRKNPFAVLEAFEQLIERMPDAPIHLVIKHKGGDEDTPARREFAKVVKRIRDHTTIIDQPLSDNGVKNLVRNANCFVSLHRSEGFGRGLAESMALGIPTIGTGYSGNLDFMNADNSWLVDHTMIPLGNDEYPEGEGQEWADPDVGHAIDLMEEVVSNPAASRARAAQAAMDIARDFSPRAVGLRYLDRLEAINKRIGQKEPA